MSFDNKITRLDRRVFRKLGCTLTITPQTGTEYTATGIIDHNVAQLGEYGEVNGTTSMVSFIASDVSELQRGDTVALGNQSWTIDQLSEDDGFIVKYTLE